MAEPKVVKFCTQVGYSNSSNRMTYHPQKGHGYSHVTVLKFCRLLWCSASRGFVSDSWATFCNSNISIGLLISLANMTQKLDVDGLSGRATSDKWVVIKSGRDLTANRWWNCEQESTATLSTGAYHLRPMRRFVGPRDYSADWVRLVDYRQTVPRQKLKTSLTLHYGMYFHTAKFVSRHAKINA